MPEAIEAVGRMIAGYAHGGNAGKSYIGTVAALLCDYPKSVALECANPIRGVARETKFLPTVADVVAWCEPRIKVMRGVREYDLLCAAQLRERAQVERERSTESLIDRSAIVGRIRREMAAAGMPFEADRQHCHGETVESVKAKLGLSDAQWDAITDLPRDTWHQASVDLSQYKQAAE